jgi:hypothetical protein
MMPGDNKSYLEQCIEALPPEKREAARCAFYEISETGDDSYLSKLLTVLEANGAYAKRIPKEMTEAGAKVVREMEDMSGRIVELEVYRRESFKKAVTAETERLVNSLPVREINIGIGRQNDLLERLRVAATKIETGVSSGLVVMLVFFAFACGMALPVWLFWDRYHEGQQNKAFCDAAGDAGIHMRIQTSESGSRFTITGPSMTGTTPKYDEHNTATGLAIDFSKPQ